MDLDTEKELLTYAIILFEEKPNKLGFYNDNGLSIQLTREEFVKDIKTLKPKGLLMEIADLLKGVANDENWYDRAQEGLNLLNRAKMRLKELNQK